MQEVIMSNPKTGMSWSVKMDVLSWFRVAKRASAVTDTQRDAISRAKNIVGNEGGNRTRETNRRDTKKVIENTVHDFNTR
jgi:hypothetical protein